jgi:hypothetical protein
MKAIVRMSVAGRSRLASAGRVPSAEAWNRTNEITRNESVTEYLRDVSASAPTDQDVRLAEYAALRSEIGQRSAFQQALNALNLTAISTIAGLVVANHAANGLLLFVPVISSTFGLLWLDHHRNIGLIATYVREELWQWTPSWESWFALRRSIFKEIAHFGAIGLVYGGASGICLGLGWPGTKAGTGDWLLAVAGLLLLGTFVLAYLAVTFGGPSRARLQNRRNAGP